MSSRHDEEPDVLHHLRPSRCTLDSAGTASKNHQAGLHDKRSVTSNAAAVAFLLDSLAPAFLAGTVSKKTEVTDHDAPKTATNRI